MKTFLLLMLILILSSSLIMAQEATSEEEAAAAKALAEKKQATRQIQELEIETAWIIPDDSSKKLEDTSFPELNWKKPEIAKTAFADTTLSPRWFDKDLNEVTKPEKPGRYTAYIEKDLLNGTKFRRFITIYAYDNSNGMWWDKVSNSVNTSKIDFKYMPFDLINKKTWEQQSSFVSESVKGQIWDFMWSKNGALMLSSLSEIEPIKAKKVSKQIDNMETRNQDYNLALKMKVLNITPKKLELPKKVKEKSTTLRKGTLAEAGISEKGIEKIRQACKDWQKGTENGFTVCIVRNGVIAFYEAFPGKKDKEAIGEKVTLNTKFPTASVTKLHAGLLLAQFIDQGLINLDDPAGKYLPDFPTTGDKVITVRQLMNHNTGLDGHGNFGGMNNPFLETDEMIGIEFLHPGLRSLYNGMGIDLTGKIMEVVSGKSIFRLFQENFFTPIGQDNPDIHDLGYGLNCTVMDLARVTQMMLNKGSYGNTVFFSPETFDKLTPIPANTYSPNAIKSDDVTWIYGVGMMPATYGTQGYKGLNHGSATATSMLADMERNVAICMSRYTPEGHEKYWGNFYNAIADAIIVR